MRHEAVSSAGLGRWHPQERKHGAGLRDRRRVLIHRQIGADRLARAPRGGRDHARRLVELAPHGIKDKPTLRYFRADSPIAWTEARDRLAAAGLLDLALAGWMLSIDPKDFRAHRAEPLPGGTRNSFISTTFTLAVYPEGVGGPKKVRWFKASRPTLWDAARDRLADAGILDFNANKPMDPGYWILVTSPEAFKEDRAEPLPGPKRPRGATRAAQRFTLEGRTILRDGDAILYVDRVDLGDQRYAISPHHADVLTQRMVRLLNRHGAR